MSQTPPRYFNLIFFALVAALMSGMVSLAVTWINLGPRPDILLKWLPAWGFAFLIAYPVAMIASPPCRKLTLKMLGHSEAGTKDNPS